VGAPQQQIQAQTDAAGWMAASSHQKSCATTVRAQLTL